MNRKTMLAMTVALVMVPALALAQLNLPATDNVDPNTKATPDQWIQLMQREINGKAVVGRPQVFLLNATGQELITVTCDGYQLVGPKAYNHNVPTLPAWKATMVDTTKFDGYCKSGLVAQSELGSVYKGALVSADGSFSNAIYITFKNPQ